MSVIHNTQSQSQHLERSPIQYVIMW